MILPINNEGIFIVTLGFSEQSNGNFYAGLKDECQLPIDVYNDPVERFEHERIAELGDFSDLAIRRHISSARYRTRMSSALSTVDRSVA